MFIKSYYDKTNLVYGNVSHNNTHEIKRIYYYGKFRQKKDYFTPSTHTTTINSRDYHFHFLNGNLFPRITDIPIFSIQVLQLFSCHIRLGLRARTKTKTTTRTRTRRSPHATTTTLANFLLVCFVFRVKWIQSIIM